MISQKTWETLLAETLPETLLPKTHVLWWSQQMKRVGTFCSERKNEANSPHEDWVRRLLGGRPEEGWFSLGHIMSSLDSFMPVSLWAVINTFFVTGLLYLSLKSMHKVYWDLCEQGHCGMLLLSSLVCCFWTLLFGKKNSSKICRHLFVYYTRGLLHINYLVNVNSVFCKAAAEGITISHFMYHYLCIFYICYIIFGCFYIVTI